MGGLEARTSARRPGGPGGPDELRDIGRVTVDAATGLVARIQELHAAIARRSFPGSDSGSGRGTVRLLHDEISALVYGGVRAGLRGVGVLADVGLAVTGAGRDHRLLSRSRAGRIVIGALNGLYGDHLHASAPALAGAMSLRGATPGGRCVDLPCDAPALAAGYPRATGRIVVFVHGLCETEEWWLTGREDRVDYGARLAADLGYTPLYLRYNSGRHISDNGVRLDELLSELVTHWPVPVSDLALVGHSMGGLVARGAVHHGLEAERAWTRVLRHLVCLGSPHRGAPLEAAANRAAWALRQLPETRPLSTVLRQRSVGIKDLRFGALLEQHWADRDPDALRFDGPERVAVRTSPAGQRLIAATITRAPTHPLGRAFGDGLVLAASARDGAEDAVTLGGLHHFDLLHHPLVYAQLRDWLNPAGRA